MHLPTRPPASRQHGFILITVLLTLVLIATIGTTLLLKSTSELQQVGNSQALAQARASAEAGQADMFFAVANPGVAVITRVIKPYSDAFASSNGNAATTSIIPNSAYSTVLANIKAQMPDLVGTANGINSLSSITFRTMRTDTGGYVRTGTSQVQPYFIDYSITAQGTQGVNKRTVTTEGTIKILLGRLPLNQYILLANDGGGGTDGRSGWLDSTSSYDGPVHVNRNLSLSGTPTFSAGLSLASDSVFMNTSCTSFTFVTVRGQQSSGCTVPNTGGNGIQYSVPTVALPTNAASQNRAALGLDSTDLTQPSPAEICTALTLVPCTSVPNATYVPIRNGRPSGGIYLQGNGQVTLSTLAGRQIYRLTDASNRVTTVTTDYVANTTTVVTPSGASTTYPGLLNGQVYVTGDLTSLSGPARTGALPIPLPASSVVPSVIPPALAPLSQLNIAAGGAVNVTGDVTYSDDPRTVNNAQNVLGIISGTKNVNIGTTAPRDVYLQAAILTGAAGTGLGVVNPNSGGVRGSIHLLGSLAEDTDQIRGYTNNSGTPVSGYSDDLHFDQRFTNGAVAPPYFPATTRFAVQTSFPIQRSWTER